MEKTRFPRLLSKACTWFQGPNNFVHRAGRCSFFTTLRFFVFFFLFKYQYFNQMEVNVTVTAGSRKSRQAATVVTVGSSRWKQPCPSFHFSPSSLCSTRGNMHGSGRKIGWWTGARARQAGGNKKGHWSVKWVGVAEQELITGCVFTQHSLSLSAFPIRR